MTRSNLAYVVVLGLSAGALAQDPPAAADPSSKTGTTFVEHLAAGRYAEAADMVDESVKAQMDADVLKTAWTAISAGKGEFRNVGTPSVSDVAA